MCAQTDIPVNLIVKAQSFEQALDSIKSHDLTIREITVSQIKGDEWGGLLTLTDATDEQIATILNEWFTETMSTPFPVGTLLHWNFAYQAFN